MSKHTPGPWHFVPWHIEEGQPAVRCAEGWIVATTSNDANAEFIARAPAMEARIAELEAERDELVRFKGDAIRACAKHRCSKWEAALMDAEARAEKAEAEVERLRKGIAAVSSLIADSSGVYGLHLNGDPAPWDELLSGGRFEEWLADFDAARGES